MTPPVAGRLHPQLTFLSLAVLINILASVATHGASDPAHRRLISLAASLDMTVTVSACYYWLIIRPGLRPRSTLIFIVLLGLLRASFAFPEVIPGKAFLAGGAEAALIAFLALGFRRARQLRNIDPESDPGDRIRVILSGIIPFATAERALAAELSVLYYAFAWRAKPHVPHNSRPFTLHRKSGFNDLILFFALASLLEVVPVHLVVARGSVTGAWILTALSLYGALWALALSRSFELRPTLLSGDAILVRFGLLFSLRIPFTSIRSVSREPIPGAVLVPRSSQARVFLEFTHPLEAVRALGFTRLVNAIGLDPDGGETFEQALSIATSTHREP